MDSTIELSVIIPFYNAKPYIVETLDSLLLQTFQSWECILVDDGSTDDTFSVINHYIDDNKFRYFKIQNSGPSRARNYGVSKAQGKFLFFLDADDLLPHYSFEELIKPFQVHSDIGLVYGGVALFKESPNNWHYTKLKRVDFSSMLMSNSLTIHSIMLKKAAFLAAKGFDDELITCEDWHLWLRLLLKKEKFFGIPHIVAYYRDVENSNGKNKMRMQKDKLDMFIKLHREFKPLFLELQNNKINTIRKVTEYVIAQSILTGDRKNVAVQRAGLIKVYLEFLRDEFRLSPLQCKMQLNWLYLKCITLLIFSPKGKKKYLTGAFSQ